MITFPILIIIFILSRYNIIFTLQFQWIYHAINIVLFVLILFILFSGIILVYAFRKHPEKRFINIVLKLEEKPKNN